MSLATNLYQKVIVHMGYDNIETNITLVFGHGSILPDPSITGPYNLFWWNASEYLNPTDDPFVEIVKCIAKLGDTLVVMRSQQYTLASLKNIPGKLYNMAYLPNSNLDTLSYYNIPQTHGISVHTGTIGTWTNIDKTTSSIADIATKSHTLLTDIGTNTHVTIDTAILNSITHIGASIAHSVTSNIVGISDTQTLTNKTLTSPFISTIYGSSIANDIITIEGTSNATKTSSYVILQPTSGNVGIGNTTPAAKLDVNGSIAVSGTVDGIDISSHAANVTTLHLPSQTGNSGKYLTTNGTVSSWSTAGGPPSASIWLGAESAYLPATNPAVFNEVSGSTTYAGWSYLAFDDTTAQTAVWRVPVSKYDGGNITIKAFSKPQITPAGVVTLQYDILTIGLANDEEYNSTVLVDTGVNIIHSLNTTTLSTELNIASAIIDPANVAADDLLVIGISRDVVSDNLVGNGQLLGVLLEYTKI